MWHLFVTPFRKHMELILYHIDAFANKAFEGNPAAICPLQTWLPDRVMQSIAEENNLSETAFFISTENGFHIRWFTPTTEVDLCGHATLASAYVLFEILGYDKDEIKFTSKSGLLTVKQKNEWFVMDFPAQPPVSCGIPNDFVSRFFASNYGIFEDPVTGSAFTQLAPYWSEKLGKTKLNAKQVSSRGGEVKCELLRDRVLIAGKAVKYLEGKIEI